MFKPGDLVVWSQVTIDYAKLGAPHAKWVEINGDGPFEVSIICSDKTLIFTKHLYNSEYNAERQTPSQWHCSHFQKAPGRRLTLDLFIEMMRDGI